VISLVFLLCSIFPPIHSLLSPCRYACALGLPPSWTGSYPYQSWGDQHAAGVALLRYLYLPPINETISRAPSSWHDTTTLYGTKKACKQASKKKINYFLIWESEERKTNIHLGLLLVLFERYADFVMLIFVGTYMRALAGFTHANASRSGSRLSLMRLVYCRVGVALVLFLLFDLLID
jgi:hypothetical protein